MLISAMQPVRLAAVRASVAEGRSGPADGPTPAARHCFFRQRTASTFSAQLKGTARGRQKRRPGVGDALVRAAPLASTAAVRRPTTAPAPPQATSTCWAS